MTEPEHRGPSPSDWPFPPNDFVPASRLLEKGATDQEVREAIREVENR